MVQITGYTYDGGSAGLDGNLTTLTQYQDATSGNNRASTFTYDFRNRRVSMTGEKSMSMLPIPTNNLDRITEIQNFNTSSSGNLVNQTRL